MLGHSAKTCPRTHICPAKLRFETSALRGFLNLCHACKHKWPCDVPQHPCAVLHNIKRHLLVTPVHTQTSRAECGTLQDEECVAPSVWLEAEPVLVCSTVLLEPQVERIHCFQYWNENEVSKISGLLTPYKAIPWIS